MKLFTKSEYIFFFRVYTYTELARKRSLCTPKKELTFPRVHSKKTPERNLYSWHVHRALSACHHEFTFLSGVLSSEHESEYTFL